MNPLQLDWYNPKVKYAIAVSGGGDSLALLHLVAEKIRAENLQVLLVNHGWNAAFAKRCEQTVRRNCAKLNIPLTVIKVAGVKPKTNPEAAARKARYAAFKQACDAHHLHAVLLGHTQSDQAEQFLLRAGKGSGLSGLSGIPERNTVSGVPVIRPLLNISRAQLRTYLTRKKIVWVEDPTNATSARGKIRARLKGDWLDESAVAASMASLARANAALDHVTEKAATQVTPTKTGWALERDWLLGLPEEIGLRLLAQLTRDESADFAPRTSKRETLLANIAQNPKGAATLGAVKLAWQNGAVTVTKLKV